MVRYYLNDSGRLQAVDGMPKLRDSLVWIDLSREHYGIHGTPEPDQIGRAASHGCVRMTNWDAMTVASLVKPGTKVLFTN